jgi:beta-mannanase
MVTLEFWSTQTGGVSTITNGSKDAYLNAFADAAKAYGGEVWLRPFHEMNSNWYPWAGATAGNSAPQVVAAWNHVRQIFVARGATNVKFVWNVNNESVPNTAANSIAAYWPGDANVDLLAIDGYNFGTSASWSTWRSFSSVIGSSYAAVTSLSAKPLFLAETGSVEQGGDKAAWITDMFASLATRYPRITGVCWFNVNDTAANTDWRIDSSPASLLAFNAAVANPY